MEPIQFSIVVPAFNGVERLCRTLKSLVNQDCINYEVIVVDDCSDQPLESAISEYLVHSPNGPLVSYYRLSSNSGGPARPRNFGVRVAKAPFIMFCDSDDEFSPSRMKQLFGLRLRGDTLYCQDLVISREERFTLLPSRIRSKVIINSNGIVDYNRISAPLSSWVISKRLFEELGGFDESSDIVSFEDFFFLFKLCTRGFKVTRIEGCGGTYNIHSANISTSNVSQRRRFRSLRRKMMDRNGGAITRTVREELHYRLLVLYLNSSFPFGRSLRLALRSCFKLKSLRLRYRLCKWCIYRIIWKLLKNI
jgi:glycosyltransferase involved in cell wall biosynthesis